jgi:uncharacterized protein YbjT (DUF2867 family)
MMSRILVTGATGNIGSALVGLLRARGQSVRALVRDPRRADAIAGSGAELAVGDFADRASLRAAAEGVDVVFLLCGNVPDQVDYECAMIDEAAQAGVRRIVKQSARGAALGDPVTYWHWHATIEQHLRASGVPSVVLQPSFLMSNLLAAVEHVRTQGMLFAPVGDARIAMVDPVDVASVAAEALTTEGHEGETYVLTGPEPISYAKVADHLSAATGRPVGYADVPAEAALAALVAAGLPPFAAEQVVTVFGALRRGVQATTTDVVPVVCGRPAGSFAAFARRHAGVFGADLTASVSASR